MEQKIIWADWNGNDETRVALFASVLLSHVKYYVVYFIKEDTEFSLVYEALHPLKILPVSFSHQILWKSHTVLCEPNKEKLVIYYSSSGKVGNVSNKGLHMEENKFSKKVVSSGDWAKCLLRDM